MGNTEVSTAPAFAPDVDLDIRWAAWIERGRAHERRARHRFVVRAVVLTLGIAMLYAFLGS